MSPTRPTPPTPRTRMLSLALAGCLATCALAGAQPADQKAKQSQKEQEAQKSAPSNVKFGQGVTKSPTTPKAVDAKQASTKVVDNANGPLNFEGLEHNFGAIPDTDPVEHAFKFVNNHDKSLRITARGSCGCTVPTLAKANYAPGEEGEIVARFNPKRRSGSQTKSIRIMFPDAPDVNDMQLTIQADVEALVQMEPNKAYLRDVARETGGSETITITGRKPGFEIISATAEGNYVELELSEPKITEKDGQQLTQYTMIVSVPPNAPIGRITERISIETNDDRIDVPPFMFNADVVGALRSSPQRMYVRRDMGDNSFITQARLDSRELVDFNIRSIDVQSPSGMQLVADFTKQPAAKGSVYMIKVSGLAPDIIGTHSGEVIVTTDLDDETIRIPFIANVRKAQANAAR